MRKQYGPEKAEKVFYASKNAGKISGVDEQMDSYKHIGYILAEALGLIEARSVHDVGSRRERPDDPADGRKGSYFIRHGRAGKPGTGKGGTPREEIHREAGLSIRRPGPHSTGGSERGVKKGEKRQQEFNKK